MILPLCIIIHKTDIILQYFADIFRFLMIIFFILFSKFSFFYIFDVFLDILWISFFWAFFDLLHPLAYFNFNSMWAMLSEPELAEGWTRIMPEQAGKRGWRAGNN